MKLQVKSGGLNLMDCFGFHWIQGCDGLSMGINIYIFITEEVLYHIYCHCKIFAKYLIIIKQTNVTYFQRCNLQYFLQTIY